VLLLDEAPLTTEEVGTTEVEDEAAPLADEVTDAIEDETPPNEEELE
jgi:hypothetical protein